MIDFDTIRKGLLIVFMLVGLNTYAQSGKYATVKGRILNKTTKEPFTETHVSIADITVDASPEGFFAIEKVPFGEQKLIVTGFKIKSDTSSVNVNNETTNTGDIFVTSNDASSDGIDIPTINIEENAAQNEENTTTTTESSSGFYVADNDPFLYTAAVVFGPFRFKPRGYDNSDVHINGIPLQDLESGYASTGQVGGLNDVLHSRDITYGLKPSDFSFGGVKGSTNINATAADQREGTNFSYYNSNGAFKNRLMLTHSSGVQKNGWAYSLSASHRWANEGYVPGTFYNAYSFYGSVSKVTKKGSLSLTAYGAPTTRGKASYELDEVYDLTNSHYFNSSWGYQNGQKRNSAVANSFQPAIIANYIYKPNENTRWNTSFGYEYGKYENSSIDIYNGYSPYSTYYKNLPSYYLNGITTPNPIAQAALAAQYRAHPELLQIQWDNLYNDNLTNIETINNVDGVAGQNVTGKRSIYVVSNTVDNMSKFTFNTNITHVVNDKVTINGGLDATSQSDEYYKQLTDLLGGDFFVNFNQFAVQSSLGGLSYLQNDLLHPNKLIKVGDKYGYDYTLRALKANLWGQAQYSYEKFDMFIAAQGGMLSFNREGLMKNSLFPDNSYGTSATHSFNTYRVKGGITYKINPKNSLYINAGYFNDAPKIDYTYISDKTRDFIVDNPQNNQTKTVEAGYLFHSSFFNSRITGYVTDNVNNTIIKRFFNDEAGVQSFVNFIMTGVNTRSIGTEFSASAKITKELTATAIAAVGQSFYTDNPNVSVYIDNDPSRTASPRQVYIKNYYLGVGPQSIYSLGLKYNSKKYWHANIDFNLMDRNYIEINPDSRTQLAGDMVDSGSKKWNQIFAQEKLASAFTIDISGGKSISLSKYFKKLNHRTLLSINGGIYNLLNNQDIKTSGYEQLRFDFTNKNAEKFPSKYAYAYGINYHVTIALKF